MSDRFPLLGTPTLKLDNRGHDIWGRDHDKTEIVVEDYGLWKTPVDAHAFSCHTCDAYPGLKYTDTTASMDSDCPYPDGFPEIKVRIDVPSGQLIINDSLRDVYTDLDDLVDKRASYNSKLGQKQAIEHYATQGCAYGPVGNSSPSFYLTGNDEYKIVSPGYDDDDELITPAYADGNELASIDTCLWAYSIADYGDFKAKGGFETMRRGYFGELQTEADVAIVDVTPGTYEFTYYGGAARFDDHWSPSDTVWASVKRVDG